MKFNVGDKVKIVCGDSELDKPHIGKIGIILKITNDWGAPRIHIDTAPRFFWYERHLERTNNTLKDLME